MSEKPVAKDVEIDFLRAEDVDQIVSYWYDMPPEEWRARGVEVKMTLSREEFRDRVTERMASGANLTCIVVYKGRRIGMHSLTDMESTSAVMHAHFWDRSVRGKGIGTISYVKAMQWFFDKHGFQKIIFKTPKKNPVPNRVKQKLGIPILGEVIFEAAVLAHPVPAWLSEVTPADMPRLLKLIQSE